MTWKDCTIFSSDWCLSWNHFSQKVSVSWLVNFIRRIYFWKYWLEKGILCSFLMWIIFKLKLYFSESLVLMACEFHQMNKFLKKYWLEKNFVLFSNVNLIGAEVSVLKKSHSHGLWTSSELKYFWKYWLEKKV